MHVQFDNPYRFRRNVYYFQYFGIRFKLVQNDPRKWSDVLLTIVDTSQGTQAQRAYAVAGEFASALSWELNVGTAIHGQGGPGIPQGFTLRRARCVMRVFPTLPFLGSVTGFRLDRIARIDNDEQRLGLALYREAKGANKLLLSILLYWQIIQGGQGFAQAVTWIDTVAANPPNTIYALRYVGQLPLGGQTLGSYLLEDCRHAIAHIRRQPGRRPLRFDDANEDGRLWASAQVLEELARHYIQTVLGVTESLYLVRKGGRGFPTFLDVATIQQGWYLGVR